MSVPVGSFSGSASRVILSPWNGLTLTIAIAIPSGSEIVPATPTD